MADPSLTVPRGYVTDPTKASPDNLFNQLTVPMGNYTQTVTDTVGYYPTGTIVQYAVHGQHNLIATVNPPSNGYYGLRGRTCQGGVVGTTAFGSSLGGSWNACSTTLSISQTDHSGYISLGGTVTLTHFSDPGNSVWYQTCTYQQCFVIDANSSLTLTRASASMDLTSLDVTPQSPGLWIVPPRTAVTLGWSVTPASVSSDGSIYTFGAIVDSKGWEITRPGGKVVACPYYYVGGSYRYCQVNADSALQVSLTAIVNGQWQTKIVRVIPRRNFKLTVDRDIVTAGDTATFRPMLDGQAVPASRWRWAPDTVGQETSTGTDAPNYTRKKSVVNTGVMWAYVDAGGSPKDSASVRVCVSYCATGDSVLDHQSVRDALKQIWDSSGATTEPDFHKKRERGAAVFDSAGVMVVRIEPLAVGATACETPPNVVSPWPGQLLAYIHVHPFVVGDSLPAECAPDDARRRGDPVYYGVGPVNILSYGDWSVAEGGAVDVYAFDLNTIARAQYTTNGMSLTGSDFDAMPDGGRKIKDAPAASHTKEWQRLLASGGGYCPVIAY